VYGFQGRLKGICDSLAKEGYLVIMPDCHRGETADVEGKADMFGWIAESSWEAVVKGDVEAVMSVFAMNGIAPEDVGALGFCFGAWVWAKAASEGVNFGACVSAHPSVKLEEYAFKESQEAMMKKVKCPYLFQCAGNDDDKCKPGGVNVVNKGVSVVFEDMSHGWCSRGDISDEKVKRDVDLAMKGAIDFFKENL
jgi:dienelactone hydrolase